MGVDRPANSFFFQSKLLPGPPSGFHLSTSPFSVETRFCCGPRQFGQSIGSTGAAILLVASTPMDNSNEKQISPRLCRGLAILFGSVRITDSEVPPAEPGAEDAVRQTTARKLFTDVLRM